jgi:hypothetical protein
MKHAQLPSPLSAEVHAGRQGGAWLGHGALTHRTDCTDYPSHVAKASPENPVGAINPPSELVFVRVGMFLRPPHHLWVALGGGGGGIQGSKIKQNRPLRLRVVSGRLFWPRATLKPGAHLPDSKGTAAP